MDEQRDEAAADDVVEEAVEGLEVEDRGGDAKEEGGQGPEMG